MGESERPPTKDERIEYLADLMVARLYRTRITARELAPKWGVSYRTIENDACDAARLLRVDPSKRDAAQARVAAWYEAVAADALRAVNEVTGLPDYASAIKAMQEYAKLAGLDAAPEAERPAPPKIEIVAPPGVDSDDE